MLKFGKIINNWSICVFKFIRKEFVEESGKASGKSWGSVILSRLAKTFRTHVLKIDFDQLTGIAGTNSTQSGNDAVQGNFIKQLISLIN